MTPPGLATTTGIHLIEVPFDSGHRDVRMGRGPGALAGAMKQLLQGNGYHVDRSEVDPGRVFRGEATMAFAIAAELAAQVRDAAGRGQLPLVLSGNCNAALGTITGLGSGTIGVVWLDAHGEFNTPETTASGFLDGMGLAVATGRCWRTMASRVPGFRPLPDSHLLLVGAREFDAEEERELRRTAIAIVQPPLMKEYGVAAAMVPALAALRERVTGVYVHMDLDVLDPGEATANPFPAANGLSVDDVEAVLRLVRERFTIRGIGLASYDPDADRDERARAAALRCVEALQPAPASVRG